MVLSQPDLTFTRSLAYKRLNLFGSWSGEPSLAVVVIYYGVEKQRRICCRLGCVAHGSDNNS